MTHDIGDNGKNRLFAADRTTTAAVAHFRTAF
jgi:hypothetical protein